MYKKILSYALIIGFFGYWIWFFVDKGNHLQIATDTVRSPIRVGDGQGRQGTFGLFLLQILAIVITARVFGRLAGLIKQPVVVGEMVAGICLGPSLLGWITPAGSQWLFPAESLKALSFLSQMGLLFFMFIVGMELDTANVKRKAHQAIMVSHVSIIVPFFLGVITAYCLYRYFTPEPVRFLSFALFLGTAMSITAFPVLARIVQERGLTGTPIGTLVITCAAADDITAWCILALVVAVVKAHSVLDGLFTIGMAITFLAFVFYLVKPWLARQIEGYTALGKAKSMVALVFITMLAAAWVTETIGIHALFGAFISGIIIPSNDTLRKLFREKVEAICTVLLVPLFFAFTGMRTQIGLIAGQQMWLVFGIIMLCAVAGKFLGSAVTARLLGQSWPDSLAIGSLMNTRGLVELVVLNIGYELGILSPGIFAIMVLMALVTTFMTVPLLNTIVFFEKRTTAVLKTNSV